MNEDSLKQLNIARKLVFCTIILYIAVFFVMNSPSLTGDNINRFFFNIRSAVTEDVPEDGTVRFDESKMNTVSVFKDGLAVLSQKTISVYSKNNLLMSENAVNFSEPVLKQSANYLLAFDRGSNTLMLSDSFDVRATRTVNEEIINASVNDDGYVVMITETYGYKAKVTVMNRRLEDIYYWYSSRAYLLDAVFSTSNVISVIGLVSDKEVISTVIERINFRTGEEQKSFTVEDAFPLAICKKSDNSIEIITDSGIYSVRNDGSRKIYSYINTNLDNYYQDSRCTVFSWTDNAASGTCSVEAITSTGSVLFRKQYQDIKAVACYYDVYLVLSDTALYVLDSTGKELLLTEVQSSANGIAADRDALYITGASYAARTDISKAFS